MVFCNPNLAKASVLGSTCTLKGNMLESPNHEDTLKREAVRGPNVKGPDNFSYAKVRTKRFSSCLLSFKEQKIRPRTPRWFESYYRSLFIPTFLFECKSVWHRSANLSDSLQNHIQKVVLFIPSDNWIPKLKLVQKQKSWKCTFSFPKILNMINLQTNTTKAVMSLPNHH